MIAGPMSPRLLAAAHASAAAMAGGALGVLASGALGFANDDSTASAVIVGHFLFSAVVLVAAAQLAPHIARETRSILLIVGSFVAVQLPLVVISVVNLGIAGGAVFSAKLDTLWLALLAGPALVGIALVIGGGQSDGDVDDDDAENASPTIRARLLPSFVVSRAAGKPAPMTTFAARTVRGLYTAMYTALLCLVLTITYAYWRFLNDALFESSGANFTDWFSTIPSLLRAMTPILIVVPLVLFLVDLAAGAAYAFDDWRLKSQNVSAQREFTPDETAYVAACIAAINRYLADKKYPYAYGFAYWLGFVAVIGLMFLVGYGSLQMQPALWESLRSARTTGVEPLYYSGGAPAVALIDAVFASIFLVWAIFQASIFVAPEFAEYMYAREGWNSMASKERNAEDFAPFVIRQLRAGVLSPERDLHPPALIRAAFRQHESVIFGATGVLWTTVAVFFYLDVSSYRLFTDDKILYTDYWSSTRKEIPYHAVDHVETSCWINNKNEPIVGYEIYLDKSRSENVLSFEDLRKETLPVERVDRKLRDAHVNFRHAARRNALNDGNAFEAACLDRLRDELGEIHYARAERLLNASDTPQTAR